MTDNSRQTLDRIARRVPVPESAFERMLRRRARKERTRRISATVVALALVGLIAAGFLRSFDTSQQPATPSPTPSVGIPSSGGGWITYGTHNGVWAMDPDQPQAHIK